MYRPYCWRVILSAHLDNAHAEIRIKFVNLMIKFAVFLFCNNGNTVHILNVRSN